MESIYRLGEQIGSYEMELTLLNKQKEETKEAMSQLEGRLLHMKSFFRSFKSIVGIIFFGFFLMSHVGISYVISLSSFHKS